jgi:HD-like signal output (HDOD) protein
MLAGISNTSHTTYEAEYRYFGTTHCEVGLCLAQRWNFPPAYCEVISSHHTSTSATEEPLLNSIVALADFYCLSHIDASSFAQASLPGDSEENAWSVLKQLSRKPIASGLEHFLSDMDEEYEQVKNEVDLLFSTMITV